MKREFRLYDEEVKEGEDPVEIDTETNPPEEKDRPDKPN